MGEHDESPGREATRRAALLGGAVTDDLEPVERAELDRLLDQDSAAARELDELRAVLGSLPPRGSGWTEPPVPPLRLPGPHGVAPDGARDRRDVVVPAGSRGDDRRGTPSWHGVPSRRGASSRRDDRDERSTQHARRPAWLLGAAAAALLVAGAGAGLGLGALAERPPSGPPGTLGAVEQVAVVGEPPGVEADVAVVAHTWGTETVLDVAGLPEGAAYRVALLGVDGVEVDSGSLLGSELPVECRLNAALLREDVDRLVVLDAADDVVMSADLPAV